MRFALVNPNWDFEGSIYFGCRHPHLPLEFGYSRALLEQAGHRVALIDAQLNDFSPEEVRLLVTEFCPDFTVVTTAPSYLFWRCAPPELRVPKETIELIRGVAGKIVVVGPHGSTTPRATLRKLRPDFLIMGECEEVLPQLACAGAEDLKSICYWKNGEPVVQGGPHASNMNALPALTWSQSDILHHHHHHHRFDVEPLGPGSEMETSRGCPYSCSFCAKDNYRNKYRRRPLEIVLQELDGLIARGIEYVYFVDEIFLPNKELLEALVHRRVKFGVQTRIDLWSFEMLDLLGKAGCVSIEAGIESISEEGRRLLDKNCKMSTEEMTARLIHAKRTVPFVQANLIEARVDEEESIESWRQHLHEHGVWANKPVPLFPYPGSPDYTKLWGLPDDYAWERAHEHYLGLFNKFSDIQEERPLPLCELENNAKAA